MFVLITRGDYHRDATVDRPGVRVLIDIEGVVGAGALADLVGGAVAICTRLVLATAIDGAGVYGVFRLRTIFLR